MADPLNAAVDTLIIACGNPMRGDDGVGPIIAEQVENTLSREQRERHRVVITHQLLPELALDLSQAKHAILIDARIPDGDAIGEVRVDPVTPDDCLSPEQPGSEAEAGLTHHWTFPRLLAMSQMLYGRAPTGHTVSVSTDAFDHTDTLSPAVQAAVPAMCDHVLRLISLNG